MKLKNKMQVTLKLVQTLHFSSLFRCFRYTICCNFSANILVLLLNAISVRLAVFWCVHSTAQFIIQNGVEFITVSCDASTIRTYQNTFSFITCIFFLLARRHFGVLLLIEREYIYNIPAELKVSICMDIYRIDIPFSMCPILQISIWWFDVQSRGR